jgi:glycine C-acetyltransferase
MAAVGAQAGRETPIATGRPVILDRIRAKIDDMRTRFDHCRSSGDYFFNQPVETLRGGMRTLVQGREMLMFASYSYLGLIGHPRIDAAAKAAIDRYGTGTHGVRMLAGSLDIHLELESAIAGFKHTEAAVTFSSGYITNLTAVSTLVGRRDVVICDKLNHASIVDGCLLSGASFERFRHNDLDDLERCLRRAGGQASKLVVADAVFSMEGDIIDLPGVVNLCRRYGAWLMIDEAHSVGVLGRTGRGIEEHFGMEDAIDLKMGTLSKTIPSVGGYLAGRNDMINLLRHASRAYIFSAALPPAQAAAAKAAFEVILDEPERVDALRCNATHFIRGLKQAGFDTMRTETAIVPILCGKDERAYAMVRHCQQNGIFILPVVPPAVPPGTARLRTTVTAVHTPEEIDRGIEVMARAGKKVGLL